MERNVAQALTPRFAGYAMEALSLSLPILVGGGLKAVHDTRLSLALRHARPLEKL